jgi:AbrB family looped-hinge helix DNA binding protein
MNVVLAKVTSKGQLTLPKEIREAHAIRTGDLLAFTEGPANTISVRKMRGAGSSAGCAKQNPPLPALTPEEVKTLLRTRMASKQAIQDHH